MQNQTDLHNNSDTITDLPSKNPIKIKASELKKRIAPKTSAAPKTPQKVSREDMQKVVNEALMNIKDHSESFHKLIDGLQVAGRGDISFSTLDDVKRVLASIDPIKKQVLTIKNTLSARARTKLQEG